MDSAEQAVAGSAASQASRRAQVADNWKAKANEMLAHPAPRAAASAAGVQGMAQISRSPGSLTSFASPVAGQQGP